MTDLRPRLALLCITAAGAAVRIAGLSSESLWIDEGWSVYLASGTFPEVMLRSLTEDVHPPLLHLAAIVTDRLPRRKLAAGVLVAR